MLLFATIDIKPALVLWAPFYILLKGAVSTISTITLCVKLQHYCQESSLWGAKEGFHQKLLTTKPPKGGWLRECVMIPGFQRGCRGYRSLVLEETWHNTGASRASTPTPRSKTLFFYNVNPGPSTTQSFRAKWKEKNIWNFNIQRNIQMPFSQ